MSKVVKVSVSKLKENPFNNQLYNVNDISFQGFVKVVEEFGILVPLTIDKDFNIVSGNRRFRAALVLGLTEVPAVITTTPNSAVMSVVHNQQRVKTFSEMLSEYKILHNHMGVKQGSRTDLKGNSASLRSMVAKMFGVSVSTLNRVIALDKTIQEVLGGDKEAASKVWEEVDQNKVSISKAKDQLVSKKKQVAPNSKKGGNKVNPKSKVGVVRKMVVATPESTVNAISEVREKYVRNGKVIYMPNMGVITNDVKIYQGSSANMSQVASNSVQCIVCSPPYFQMRDYKNGKGELGRELSMSEFISNLMVIFDECKRVLKPGGSLWVNINDCFDNGVYNMTEAYLKVAMAQHGWMLHDELIWSKNNPTPVNTPRSQRTHEYFFQFKKSQNVYYNPEWLKVANSEFESMIYGLNAKNQKMRSSFSINGSFITSNTANTLRLREICRELGVDDMNHSATFPAELPYIAIQLTSKPGDIVLDPFNGTGTTGMVAMGLNRKYVGYELNTTYIKGSIARLVSFDILKAA